MAQSVVVALTMESWDNDPEWNSHGSRGFDHDNNLAFFAKPYIYREDSSVPYTCYAVGKHSVLNSIIWADYAQRERLILLVVACPGDLAEYAGIGTSVADSYILRVAINRESVSVKLPVCDDEELPADQCHCEENEAPEPPSVEGMTAVKFPTKSKTKSVVDEMDEILKL